MVAYSLSHYIVEEQPNLAPRDCRRLSPHHVLAIFHFLAAGLRSLILLLYYPVKLHEVRRQRCDTTSTAGSSVNLIRVMFTCNDIEMWYSQPPIQWKALFCF